MGVKRKVTKCLPLFRSIHLIIPRTVDTSQYSQMSDFLCSYKVYHKYTYIIDFL